MKEKILNFLKNDRSFQGALRIYMEHGQSMSVKHTLNRQGESEYNHNFLMEELRKLAGIAMDEFRFILSAPIGQIEKAKEPIDLHLPVSKKEIKAFLKEIPAEIQKTIRIREEFPFLNDVGCPNELKILVADRITAYYNYVNAHRRLFSAASAKDLLEASSSVVENYLDNQEIWKELNHFKETGKLLGEHKIFNQVDRIKEIQSMTTADLVKLKKNLENNIARNRQKVTEQPDHPESGNRTERINEYQLELNEVNRILGINA